ncbi:hypothetical protein HY29_02355 [Hyphomonas beringensis]|uniref:Glycerophosphoryl diester phosphodiesterase membrane domain-containing protein n=1 Tax=Hyphomonas beringensis TaxID=1280946 RepID=A0A062U9V5_9PROT|nr:hypothetical protein [Hyphomonas beringensis]KCZ55072.1 hypothetical protein HY29_02355 [Hyphomonas beringensis]
MLKRFTFDGALSSPFRAAHANSFPWLFAASYAALTSVGFMLLLFLGKDGILSIADTIEKIDKMDVDGADPFTVFRMIIGSFAPLFPWIALGSFGAWVIWSVFQAASQRRYVRDERFSLRFGGDELRMMVVSLLWGGLQLVFTIIPIIIFFGGMLDVVDLALSQEDDPRLVGRVMTTMLLGGFVWLILFIAYVFFATRLAPCFALTIKERRISFFDAWNVSRGRFWPILGAYLIWAIGGGMAVSVIDQILQMPIGMSVMPRLERLQTGEELVALVMSASFLIPLFIYSFLRMFTAGLLMHAVAGPAAFAARHDPRGSVDDEIAMDAFN